MRSLTILAAAASSAAVLLGAGAAAAVDANLCTEDSVLGCTMALPVGGTAIVAASDGESSFDPFGYGHDTSDGIQLDSIWQLVNAPGWVNLAGTNTWVVPACDANGNCENGAVNEGLGHWYAPGFSLNVASYTFGIYEKNGSLSDLITLYNDANNTVNLTFNSSDVPEPATWAMMLVGFGGIGAMVRRRARTAVPA